MPTSEVVITFSSTPHGKAATIETAASGYEVTLPDRLPHQYREYARLLRWKAVGLHNPGDTLLIQMGRALAELLFPPERADLWASLTAPEVRLVRLRFSNDT